MNSIPTNSSDSTQNYEDSQYNGIKNNFCNHCYNSGIICMYCGVISNIEPKKKNQLIKGRNYNESHESYPYQNNQIKIEEDLIKFTDSCSQTEKDSIINYNNDNNDNFIESISEFTPSQNAQREDVTESDLFYSSSEEDSLKFLEDSDDIKENINNNINNNNRVNIRKPKKLLSLKHQYSKKDFQKSLEITKYFLSKDSSKLKLILKILSKSCKNCNFEQKAKIIGQLVACANEIWN